VLLIEALRYNLNMLDFFLLGIKERKIGLRFLFKCFKTWLFRDKKKQVVYE